MITTWPRFPGRLACPSIHPASAALLSCVSHAQAAGDVRHCREECIPSRCVYSGALTRRSASAAYCHFWIVPTVLTLSFWPWQVSAGLASRLIPSANQPPQLCEFRPHAGMVAGRSADRSSEASAALLHRGLSSTDAADRWPSSLGSRSHAGRPIHRRFAFFQQPTGARSGGRNRLRGLLVTGTCPRPVRRRTSCGTFP